MTNNDSNKGISPYRYLFAYTDNVFNDSRSSYKIEPLLDSVVERAYVFAGKQLRHHGSPWAIPCLYIELKEELVEKNLYRNLRLI